jgi:hypothetical protein
MISCLLAGILLVGTGCVSQRAYDQVKAERNDLTRALDAERANVSELDRHIAQLKAANREEDDAATELRTAIQREQERLPLLTQRANAQLVSLQTQVANLVHQSRLLARQVADAKRESSSLKVLVAQYQQEVEEAQSIPEPFASPPSPEPASTPAPTQPIIAQPTPAVAAPNPVTPPQQMAQVTPVTPVKPPAQPRPVQTPSTPVEESWFDMVINWLSSVWNWIFGLFS